MSKEKDIHSVDGLPDPSAGVTIVFNTEAGRYSLVSHTFRGGNINVGGALQAGEDFLSGARREAREELFADLTSEQLISIFSATKATELEKHLGAIKNFNGSIEKDIDASLKLENTFATINKAPKFVRRVFVCDINSSLSNTIEYTNHLTEMGKAFTEARQAIVSNANGILLAQREVWNEAIKGAGFEIQSNGKIKSADGQEFDASDGRQIDKFTRALLSSTKISEKDKQEWKALYEKYEFVSTYSEASKFSLVSIEQIKNAASAKTQNVSAHDNSPVVLGKFVLGDLAQAQSSDKQSTFLDLITTPQTKAPVVGKFTANLASEAEKKGTGKDVAHL